MRKTAYAWIIIIVLMLLIPLSALAANDDDETVTQDEIEQEIERQLTDVDLSEWHEYFDGIASFDFMGFSSIDEMVSSYAKIGVNDSPEGIWRPLLEIVKQELKASVGAVIALAAAAIITGFSGVISDGSIKPVLSTCLCIMTVLLVTTAFASLTAEAFTAINKAAAFTQAVLPVMSGLLAAIGATASAGMFRPLMLFLSTTVISFIDSIVMPPIIAAGVLNVIDGLTEKLKLSELVKLAQKAAKWLLGLISALYFAVTALQGMSVSTVDGISVRTAKYAIDKLVPVVGSMVSGTVDSVMGCALLVKNAAGISSIIVMLGLLAGPLIKLMLGSFIFRAAAAIAQPIADARVVRLLTGASEAVNLLFAAVAATGSMFAVTIGVIIASGGVSAGLW